MERYLRRYRFLGLGILAKLLIAYFSHGIQYYNETLYLITSNYTLFVIGLASLACDILFLIDYVYYYLTIKNEVLIRLIPSAYYRLLLRRTLVSILLLLVTQMIISLCFYGQISYLLFINVLILYLLFYLLNRFSRDENKLSLILLILMILIRYLFAFI